MADKFATATLLLAAATAAFAQGVLQPSKPEPAAVDQPENRSKLASRLARGTGGAGNVRLRWRGNGTVESARGFASRSYAGTKSEAAQAFVSDYREMFGAARFGAAVERRLGSRTYVRMQQQLDGIRVRGSHVVLVLDEGNVVHAVNADVEPALTRNGEWRISKEDAIARALAAHAADPSDTPSAEQEYYAENGQAIPVWTVTFKSAIPAGDWEYMISAENGRVVKYRNMRRGATAQGYAYPKNPVRGGRERVRLDNLMSGGRLTSQQTKVFSYLPALKGEVKPGTVVQVAAMDQGNFLYEANDARAAEVQLYWGMETAAARFRALGFEGFSTPLTGVVLFQDYDPKGQRFIAANNAYFMPNAFGEGKGGMFFYLTNSQGDTSLDTDIIFHEYGHAVVNEFVGPDQSDVFGALNEGTADYFSSSFLNDPVMAEYGAKIFRLRLPYLRRTDNENAWPYNTVGEVHADGNIWSGALWDVRRALGAAVADEIALNTIAFLSPDSEFFDAADTAVFVAEELFGMNAGNTVASIMEERGIYSEAAETASLAKYLKPDASASGSISAARAGYVMVGGQQYRINVPHRATKLIVRLNATGDARFYIRHRVPVTVEGGKIQAEQLSDTGRNPSGYLSLDNTPELQAGMYYIAVVNASQSRIEYEVSVDVENYEPAARPAVVTLRDGVGVRGSMPSGPFLGSRQFAIEVPEGTIALNVTLEGDEDVDLYVRQNNFVGMNNMGFPEADIVSDSESNREDVRITGQGGRPIPPGVYVLGTYNYSSSTTKFRITARLEQ